jgi:hypothetical protein
MIGAMSGHKHLGRPHLGPRDMVATRIPLAVRDAIDVAAAACGVTRTTYVADILAQHFGRPDLMRQQMIPLPRETTATRTDYGARHFVSVKLPVPVREALDQAVSERGIGRTAYLADLLAAHVGYHELVGELSKEAMDPAM